MPHLNLSFVVGRVSSTQTSSRLTRQKLARLGTCAARPLRELPQEWSAGDSRQPRQAGGATPGAELPHTPGVATRGHPTAHPWNGHISSSWWEWARSELNVWPLPLQTISIQGSQVRTHYDDRKIMLYSEGPEALSCSRCGTRPEASSSTTCRYLHSSLTPHSSTWSVIHACSGRPLAADAEKMCAPHVCGRCDASPSSPSRNCRTRRYWRKTLCESPPAKASPQRLHPLPHHACGLPPALRSFRCCLAERSQSLVNGAPVPCCCPVAPRRASTIASCISLS